MKTVSSLLDESWYQRYKKISKLNIRSSIYDVTNRCNLRCKGCFFFSSGEHEVAHEEMDVRKWEAFVDREIERGVNLAILIGGEPTLCMDRIEAFYTRLPTFCATNGLIKVPRDRFPDMMIGVSLWGDAEAEKILRGKDTFAASSKNYEGDPYVYYLYTITPRQIGKTEHIIRRIEGVGLKVHMQLLSNDEGVDGFSWKPEELKDIRSEMGRTLVTTLDHVKGLSVGDSIRIQSIRMKLNEALKECFDRFDLLLTPTMPTEAFAAKGPPPREIHGHPIPLLLAVAFTYPFNISGHPAATVRTGLTGTGLPAGLQIIGPRHRDDLVLQAAYAYELARPWNDHWPDI